MDEENPALLAAGCLMTLLYMLWSTWTAWAIWNGGTVPLLDWHVGPSPSGAVFWLIFGEPFVGFFVVALPLTLLYGLGALVAHGIRRRRWRRRPHV